MNFITLDDQIVRLLEYWIKKGLQIPDRYFRRMFKKMDAYF